MSVVKNINEYINADKNTSSDLSEDDELIEPWENILQYFTVHHLEKLCQIFHKLIPDSTKMQPLQLTKDQFVNAVDNIIGNSQYSFQAVSLFNEIPYPESEKITWCQLLKFYVDYTSVEEHRNLSLSTSKILTVPHIRIESVAKIVPIEISSYFGYAIISKYGKVGLYDGNLNLLTSYNVIFSRTDVMNIGKPRHRKSSWITDAIFIPNIYLLVISTSARSIMIYDASSLRHKALWLIEGITNTIQCLAYCFDPDLTLLMGNDEGALVKMKFLQQKDGLFRKKYTDKLNAYYWRELFDETLYVTIKFIKKLHSNSIQSIIYCSQNSCLVTCSKDPKKSVIFYNVKENKKAYIFKIHQGISCFSISHHLRMLMTGCDNGLVQFWNSVVPSRPTAVFKQHKTSIVDVKILELKRVAISCSKDGILKVWDIFEQKCQQTLTLDFPAFSVLGKLIDWGKECVTPGPKRTLEIKPNDIDITVTNSKISNKILKDAVDPWNRSEILVFCCNYIAVIDINYETDTLMPKPNILPPPTSQNDVILPESWENTDESTINIDSGSFDESQITEYVKEALEKFKELNITENLNIEKCDINYKIAALEKTKAKMKGPVSQCAPYLALDLYEVEDPRLSAFLPVPNYKSTQKIVDQTQRLLSTESLISGILSDRSSRSRSSRSSIVEF